jgi:hypothetical protein
MAAMKSQSAIDVGTPTSASHCAPHAPTSSIMCASAPSGTPSASAAGFQSVRESMRAIRASAWFAR